MAKTPNKGTAFERRLESIFHAYMRQGRAKIHKVDQPIKVMGGGAGRKRVVMLENFHLDFVGTWTEHAGRTIILEAKYTEDRRLRIDRSGGVTESQMANLRAWRAAGAATAVAWGMGDAIKLVTVEMIDAAIDETGRVSLRWCDAVPVPAGEGYVTHDILAALAALTADL